jgi:CHRD domain
MRLPGRRPDDELRPPTTGSVHDVLDPNSLLGQTFGTGYGYPSFADLLNVFLNDGIYIDIHTLQYPSGEIRGQLFAVVPEPTGIGFATLATGLLLAGMTRRRG